MEELGFLHFLKNGKSEGKSRSKVIEILSSNLVSWMETPSPAVSFFVFSNVTDFVDKTSPESNALVNSLRKTKPKVYESCLTLHFYLQMLLWILPSSLANVNVDIAHAPFLVDNQYSDNLIFCPENLKFLQKCCTVGDSETHFHFFIQVCSRNR